MKLCFSPEFFGQVVDGATIKFTGRPTTVVQALYEMPWVEWEVMTEIIFEDYPGLGGIGDILHLIRETNTCTSLNTNPVEVWIDEKGDFKIKVYDAIV